MNTGSAFSIGKTHDVCEDYAISNKNSVVVSDGCSSSPRTDIGSRLLCLNAIRLLPNFKTIYHFKEEQCLLETRPSTAWLDLPTECLDATLLIAHFVNHPQACIYGDGYIIVELKNGYKYIIRRDYTDSYPYYINYVYDHKGRYEDWLAYHNKTKVSFSILSPDGGHTTISDKCNFIDIEKVENSVVNISTEPYRTIVTIVDISQVKYISISSDGLGSFYQTNYTDTSKTNKSISDIDVIQRLFSFKNFNGQFVQRRMNKFLKDCNKDNWYNADDISLGVIYLGKIR